MSVGNWPKKVGPVNTGVPTPPIAPGTLFRIPEDKSVLFVLKTAANMGAAH